MNKDLVAIFEYLEREKGIKRELIIGAIEEALLVAAKKSHGAGNVAVSVNPKSGDIEVYVEKEVVKDVTVPEEEISLEIAKEIDPTSEVGHWIQIETMPENFGRIAAQAARQIISGKLRSAERDVIYEEYRHRINELVSGSIKRIVTGATLIVDLGKVEGILPGRFYPKTEKYAVGDRIQALLYEVKDTPNGGAEVVLSRSHPEFVKQLFIQEVPELGDETIVIEKMVREAGYRTKMAVTSQDFKVDPVGACVGVRGTRVKNIIRELNNEKIDIVKYDEDPITLLQNLLSPIEIKNLEIDEENDTVSIVVEDEDYPAVIGKRGMNVHLTSDMIDARLDVKKMSAHQMLLSQERVEIAQDESPELDEPLEVEGVNSFILDTIKGSGFDTPRKLLNISTKELSEKSGISIEMAKDIVEKIRKQRT